MPKADILIQAKEIEYMQRDISFIKDEMKHISDKQDTNVKNFNDKFDTVVKLFEKEREDSERKFLSKIEFDPYKDKVNSIL